MIERYLSENDPWKRYLVNGKEGELNTERSGTRDALKDADVMTKPIEGNGKSGHRGKQMAIYHTSKSLRTDFTTVKPKLC